MSRSLAGKRLLILEDDYFVASDLAAWLENQGAEVVGPVGSVADAFLLINGEETELHGAILDVNLTGERSFPIAEALHGRSVPFLFVTGYEASAIPEPYRSNERMEKPVHKPQLLRLLEQLVVT